MPNADALQAPETRSADVDLGLGDWRLQAKLSVPAGLTRLRLLLPMVQSLANAVVALAAKEAEDKGQTISCKKGCAACCRQLVPISEAEARQIRDLVEELPEPRRAHVRARFAEARRRLEEAGVLEMLLHPDRAPVASAKSLGIDYFRLGIPCPFLEDESCSIHPDRPIACREYLVTSPAENCARPTAETVQCVKLPVKIWTALARVEGVAPPGHAIAWVPLVVAPEWAAAHPAEPSPRPGPELVRALFEKLTGQQ